MHKGTRKEHTGKSVKTSATKISPNEDFLPLVWEKRFVQEFPPTTFHTVCEKSSTAPRTLVCVCGGGVLDSTKDPSVRGGPW